MPVPETRNLKPNFQESKFPTLQTPPMLIYRLCVMHALCVILLCDNLNVKAVVARLLATGEIITWFPRPWQVFHIALVTISALLEHTSTPNELKTWKEIA